MWSLAWDPWFRAWDAQCMCTICKLIKAFWATTKNKHESKVEDCCYIFMFDLPPNGILLDANRKSLRTLCNWLCNFVCTLFDDLCTLRNGLCILCNDVYTLCNCLCTLCDDCIHCTVYIGLCTLCDAYRGLICLGSRFAKQDLYKWTNLCWYLYHIFIPYVWLQLTKWSMLMFTA